MALLLSSAGLAAGLLVGTPLGDASLPRSGWQTSPALAQVTSSLTSEQRAAMQALPISLSSLVPAYAPAASAELSAPLPSLVSYHPAGPTTSTDDAALPTASTLKETVQRSWDTFKLAFR